MRTKILCIDFLICRRWIPFTFMLLMVGQGFTVHGQTWNPAGPVDDNWPTFNAGNWPSITSDNAGNVYIAYPNETSKLAVRKWNGTNWTYVGAPVISTNTISDPVIKTDASGTPYVAYISGQLVVKKFENGNWNDVGSAFVFASNAYKPKLVIDNAGDLYAGYVDFGLSGKLTVRKFSNGSWANVGAAGFTSNSTTHFDLGVNNLGVPYVAYKDDAISGKITVNKFIAGSWSSVGAVGFSSGSAFDISINFDGNEPLVAYSDFAAGTSKRGLIAHRTCRGL